MSERTYEIGDCLLSPCGRYRYELSRIWSSERAPDLVMFVGLNPSTADGLTDDPTVRRWRAFAKAWGHDGMLVCNAYPLRSTDPRPVAGHEYGEAWLRNSEAIQGAGLRASRIVACWGTRITPTWQADLLELLRCFATGGRVECLGLTKDGYPRHPLYLRADTKPEPWP